LFAWRSGPAIFVINTTISNFGLVPKRRRHELARLT
jgi:hypothetical protein